MDRLTEISEASGVESIREALYGSWGANDRGSYTEVCLGRLVVVIPRSDCIVPLAGHQPFWLSGNLVGTEINKVRLGKGDLLVYARK